MAVMKGVKFGTTNNYKHSYTDYGLLLTGYTLGSPEPKTEIVDVPGMDGVLDLTSVLGSLKYRQRTLTFNFKIIKTSMYMTTYKNIMSFIHGKKLQVILDDDSAYYYYGRCSVDSFNSNKFSGTITITVLADPYKTAVSGGAQVL